MAIGSGFLSRRGRFRGVRCCCVENVPHPRLVTGVRKRSGAALPGGAGGRKAEWRNINPSAN